MSFFCLHLITLSNWFHLHLVIKASLNIFNQMPILLLTFLLTFRGFCPRINWVNLAEIDMACFVLALFFIWPQNRAPTYSFASSTFPCKRLYFVGLLLFAARKLT